jgi:hypothetical protein
MKWRWDFALFAGVFAAVFAAAALVPVAAHAAATIVVQNNDGAGEGFNDPTPWTPTGGNPATTLGQARLNAFQYAANLWATCINSNVTIVVRAQMDPLACSPTSGMLGFAGTTTVHRDFSGAPLANTWYPQALANALSGTDLSANPDINATFNSSINGDPGCLGALNWYYGFDGNPPGGNIDFITVVMHEIGHGLGFQTFVDLATGAKLGGYDDMYMVFLEQGNATPSAYPLMSNAGRVTASKSDPNLRWTGSSVTNGQSLIPLTAGLNSGYVRMHGPDPQEPGSSVSHWTKDAFPNEVMEPVYTGPDHDPGLAFNLMEDIGWSVDAVCLCAPEPTTMAAADTVTVSRPDANWTMRVRLDNAGPNDAVGVVGTMSENLAWLVISDPTCNYGDIANGNFDWGDPDAYVLDLSLWPGGTFDVTLDVAWTDGCGSPHSDSFTLTLNPPELLPVAFQQVSALPVRDAVEVSWVIFADEAYDGFNVYRRRDREAHEVRLNPNGPLDRSRRSYTDTDVEPGETYHYTVAFVMPDGRELRSSSIRATVGTYSTYLEQNRPNPFNPSTQIVYQLAENGRVTLGVYDVSGRLVRTLVDGLQPAGAYSVTWDGRDDDGRLSSTGVYFCKLTAGKFSQTRRMVLLK